MSTSTVPWLECSVEEGIQASDSRYMNVIITNPSQFFFLKWYLVVRINAHNINGCLQYLNLHVAEMYPF